MIKFEINESKEGIEIILDAEGIDELINYLQFIKSNQESFHLVAGNELNVEASQNANELVKHVKLVYVS